MPKKWNSNTIFLQRKIFGVKRPEMVKRSNKSFKVIQHELRPNKGQKANDNNSALTTWNEDSFLEFSQKKDQPGNPDNRAVGKGSFRCSFLQNVFVLSTFSVPIKICFKHLMKTKYYPIKMCFVHPNVKTWLWTCLMKNTDKTEKCQTLKQPTTHNM